MQELLTVRPGTQLDFLAAVVAERAPVLAEHGHALTGAYEVTSNQHEVVVIWATSVEAEVRLRQARDAARGLCDEADPDERLPAWDRRSLEWVTGGDPHLMTPLPRTVYGPDDWEDADLSDWLE